LKSILRILRSRTLNARMALLQRTCATLAKEFEDANLSPEQKKAIDQRWDNAMKEIRELRLLLNSKESNEDG